MSLEQPTTENHHEQKSDQATPKEANGTSRKTVTPSPSVSAGPRTLLAWGQSLLNGSLCSADSAFNLT